MNLRPDRPSDEEIKDALLSGKIVTEVCKELRTHSQRITQVKEKYGLVVKRIKMGRKGDKSVWMEGGIKRKKVK